MPVDQYILLCAIHSTKYCKKQTFFKKGFIIKYGILKSDHEKIAG